MLIVDGVSCNITSCCPAHFVLSYTHLSVKSLWLCVCVCVCEITDGGGSISASRVNLKSVLCVFMHMCVYKERLVVYNCLQTTSVRVCVFLIMKVILWFGGYFQTVCFASLYVSMASSLLRAINFPSRVSEPILAEDLSQHHIMLTLIQHDSPSSSLWIWMDWCLDEGTPAKDLHF